MLLLIFFLFTINTANNCTGTNESIFSLPIRCNNCSNDDTTKCTECAENYGLFNEDKICRSCSIGIEICDRGAQTVSRC